MKYYFLRVGFTHKILKKELLQYIRYQLIHSYSYFQIQDLIGFCHQNFIILLNSHKPILIVHASALLYITPDYMKPAEMISMSFFRNWIKTGKLRRWWKNEKRLVQNSRVGMVLKFLYLAICTGGKLWKVYFSKYKQIIFRRAKPILS